MYLSFSTIFLIQIGLLLLIILHVNDKKSEAMILRASILGNTCNGILFSN